MNNFKTMTLALALCGAFQLAPAPAHAGLFSISPEKEKKLGEEAASQIEAGAPIVSGPVSDWVQRVGAKLAAVSDSKFEYSFHVVDSPEINAFCLPGGHIYVYTGLRKIVRDDDELAAVLAHEITHAEEHHYAKQYAKSSKRGALLGAVSIFAGLPGAVTQGLGILDFSMTQKYGREHEYEADRAGLARMKRAGFKPEAMVSLLERLAAEDETSGIDKWMASHPEGKKRAAAIRAMLPNMK